MAPPPPSKSYLLKFDDSSSDEDDDDYYATRREPVRQQQPPVSQPVVAQSVATQPATQPAANAIQNPNSGLFDLLKSLGGTSSSTTSTSTPEESATIETNNDTETPATTATANTTANTTTNTAQSGEQSEESAASTKKRKKKRKKKKKTTSSSTNKKVVTFSSIHVLEFHRDVGGDGVPTDGGWPLSLSSTKYREFTLDIDEFETRKQKELKARYEKIVKRRRKGQGQSSSSSSSSKMETRSRRKRSNSKTCQELKREEKTSKEDSSSLEEHIQMPVFIPDGHVFETRQYDYRPRSADALRHELGKGDDDGDDGALELEWEEIQCTGRNRLFGQLGEAERKHLLLRDAQLSSDDQHANNNNSSNSNENKSKRKDSYSEDAFCSLQIIHIRNELEQMRIHRSAENAAGCSCRKLHVVLPSELQGGKKSHNHRRLTERRVKDELRRRHVAIATNATREELEQLLHDEVEKQGCCYGNECPCSKSGIECQADTCSCWYTSHVTASHKKGSDVAIPSEALRNCGNRKGIYVVDFDAIAVYRDHFVKAKEEGICGEITN